MYDQQHNEHISRIELKVCVIRNTYLSRYA